jgi:hypothetical protein
MASICLIYPRLHPGMQTEPLKLNTFYGAGISHLHPSILDITLQLINDAG